MFQPLSLTATPVLRARRAGLLATVATLVVSIAPMVATTTASAQTASQSEAPAQAPKQDQGWLKRLSSFLMPTRQETQAPATNPEPAPQASLSPLRADELIVPVPARQTVLEGQITLSDGMRVAVAHSDSEALAQARYFADLMKRTRNLSVTVVDAGEAATIRLVRTGTPDPKLKGGYGLQVTPAGIQISAADSAGLFYGLGSLWQLATADGRTEGPATIRAIEIKDQPRLGWRGLMVDSARHMQSIETLKQVIDVMALHKLNVFHWHIVDDQGWRLEIKKYPRLTEVGAWRVPQGQGRDVIDPATGKPKLYGGYYTQEQVKDLVAYAAARHITIVPEIEMPGHAHASVVAYPHLGSAKPAPETSSDWGIFPYIYNIDDSTFAFLEDVLDETMALFPSEYIHVGGDEAVKTQWKQSKRIQRQMKKLGIKDEHALQSYFIQRIEKHLNAKGRKLIGWDEILEGGLAPNATVMSWRGIAGAVAAAQMGHDAVLTPHPTLYFDNRQGLSEREPPGRKELVTLQRVYDFDVTPDSLTANQLKHILGVQANLWTEHMRLEENFRKMAFPRASALAELGWSQPEHHNFTAFSRRMAVQMPRYRMLGITPSETAFLVDAEIHADIIAGQADVRLKTQVPIGDIRYTLDGTEPTAQSPLYQGPFRTSLPKTVKAVAFFNDKPLSSALTHALTPEALRTRGSRELATCTANLAIALEDDSPATGPRAISLIDIMNPCWIWQAADLRGIGTVDVTVTQMPFNFQIGDDKNKITFRKPATPEGEVEVRAGGCDGQVVAVAPLKPAVGVTVPVTLSAPLRTDALPADRRSVDLCVTYTAKGVEPMWGLTRMTLVPSERP